MGEFGLDVVWAARERLEIRGGYRVLHLTGIGLAAEQRDVGRDTSDSAIYHGPMISVRALW
jgi:hypothetical protein